MSMPADTREPIRIDQLNLRKRTLEQRLEDGDRRIEEGALLGQDVRAWEDFWLTLLAEYESICDELDQAA